MLKFIDNNYRALKSTISIAPEDLDKDHRTMGWFTKDIMKLTFTATKKIAKEVIYRCLLRYDLKSRQPYLTFSD